MIGFDTGTYNLVCCKRDKDGNFIYKKEVNAFLEMPLENKFVFNMMKTAGVPLIERPNANIAYALGEKAVDMAYAMSHIGLKRPMRDGCLNPDEKHAQQVMSVMIHSLIESLSSPNEILYYSVPANAVNEETDADYHEKVVESIFNAFEDESGYKLKAFPINEGLALVYSELAHKAFTGLSASFGGGMVNVCYSIFGAPVFQFSIVNSGDWIDKMAARATGETPAYINKEKMKLNLLEEPDSIVMRAIKAQYEIMLTKTISGIKHGVEAAGNKARADHPVDVVIAGGTSLPIGFNTLFEDMIRKIELPIEIGKVIRPKDPLYSVARGCLIAAEAAANS